MPTPDAYYQLSAEEQTELMAYECIREAEEAELASLGVKL